MSTSRVWLITGTSSGFGLEMAKAALANGERVVATLRKPEVLSDFASKYTPAQLLVLRLDVSKPDEVKAAFAKAKATFGRVDVVFNNAGYAVAGELEGIPNEHARTMFDVNYWGAVHVSQEAVRFFREDNSPQGGRLIQNSAGVGLVTLPTLGFYASTKHALEGFTETLHKELNPAWNIKVKPTTLATMKERQNDTNIWLANPTQISSVLFGGFVTEFSTRSLQMLPQHPAYADDANAAAAFRKVFGAPTVESRKKLGFGDPVKGIEKVYELSKLENPPLRLLLGKDINHYFKEHIAQLTKEVDEYAAWSDNLGYENH
ncbi:hypothetical protein GSI_03296 [Ganoderma sinense ZZ0214-1]|uniref:Uncharacterized protein n=1 Tax=Ganoderma sinense ZZ0214-1 TaxID=1077348 RepID=A0A2G8SLR9_9APHY|nr:hypothetical protein GSI_03296 [Ganoderma sinense ZZ0214-1]